MAKRVLVADDNLTMRKVLCRLFAAEEQYEICAEAENGKQAIELALKHRPDLIILDLSMPVLNGIEAAQELKRLLPSVPIILFTQHESVSRSLFHAIGGSIDRIVSKSDASALMGHVRSLAPL